MADFTVTLDDKIQQVLALEAERRGMLTHELVRWVLGSWAIGELQQSFAMPKPIYMPSLGGESRGPVNFPVIDPSQGVQQVGKLMRLGAAMMGSLTCQRCTQKLSMGDVERGSCAHCEAPIE